MSADFRPFLCGTRRTVRKGPNNYRVVCATCDGGGTVRYPTSDAASKAAVRDSNKPCAVKNSRCRFP